jgi:hypothetical protein
VSHTVLLGSVRVIGGPPVPESSSTSGLAGRPSSGHVEVHLGHIDGRVMATTTAGADGTFRVGVPAGGPYVVTATDTWVAHRTCTSDPVTTTGLSTLVIVACHIP